MKHTLATLLVLTMLAPAGLAEAIGNPSPRERPVKRSVWWNLSVVLLASATTVDAASSWGRMEANPWMRGPNGRFGYHGATRKALIATGAVGAQYFLLRHHPKTEKYGTFGNLALAGVFATAAAANYSRPRRVPPAAVR